ncbi:hypothetical protein WJX84_001452 [Apatococcus fuscideae]|uniref:Peptidase S8/S53 domain-containing protein n=1 Tax=Apatococcus fuscideae TaxID=2026836 RepID=A0AAW1T1S0_9CHLO
MLLLSPIMGCGLTGCQQNFEHTSRQLACQRVLRRRSCVLSQLALSSKQLFNNSIQVEDGGVASQCCGVFASCSNFGDLATVPGADVTLCEADVQYQSELGTATPNDPQYPQQYSLVNSNVQAAWAAGFTGDSTINVCVVDTGIDYTHPDLAANIWVNPKEALNGKDNDADGASGPNTCRNYT